MDSFNHHDYVNYIISYYTNQCRRPVFCLIKRLHRSITRSANRQAAAGRRTLRRTLSSCSSVETEAWSSTAPMRSSFCSRLSEDGGCVAAASLESSASAASTDATSMRWRPTVDEESRARLLCTTLHCSSTFNPNSSIYFVCTVDNVDRLSSL